MPTPRSAFRVYIDESGDHTYRHLHQLDRRYLGLTGVVIRKSYYNPQIPADLEAMKRRVFNYDPDRPPILTRQHIRSRKGPFGVLNERERNALWEQEMRAFYESLQAQIFTVVMDKQRHFEDFAETAWNPYSYSLSVLLNRIRGWLNLMGARADVMPESRGHSEDAQLRAAYAELLSNGSTYGTAEQYSAVFPVDELLFQKKEHNVAGLQLADLVAAEQKLLTVQENNRPMPHEIQPFGRLLNQAIASKVNRYGRYLLE